METMGRRKESKRSKVTRAMEIVALLKQTYPDARCALVYNDPFQLLVATILSAQCTDERVNMVTGPLFKRFPTVADFAFASRSDLEDLIHSAGFFRQKARFIQESARAILLEHDSLVPQTMEQLLELSGVGRKTANVVLGVAFEKTDGVVVDTHVKRISKLLALTAADSPVAIERDLMAIFPQSVWIDLSHLLIFHGRRICKARKPACHDCVIADHCPSVNLF